VEFSGKMHFNQISAFMFRKAVIKKSNLVKNVYLTCDFLFNKFQFGDKRKKVI